MSGVARPRRRWAERQYEPCVDDASLARRGAGHGTVGGGSLSHSVGSIRQNVGRGRGTKVVLAGHSHDDRSMQVTSKDDCPQVDPKRKVPPHAGSRRSLGPTPSAGAARRITPADGAHLDRSRRDRCVRPLRRRRCGAPPVRRLVRSRGGRSARECRGSGTAQEVERAWQPTVGSCREAARNPAAGLPRPFAGLTASPTRRSTRLRSVITFGLSVLWPFTWADESEHPEELGLFDDLQRGTTLDEGQRLLGLG